MDNPLLTQWLTQPSGLARRLSDIAVDAGLNGADLSNLIGQSESNVSRIRNGRIVPNEETVRAWCEVCGHSNMIEDLLELLGQASARNIPWKSRVAIGHEGTQEAYTVLHRRSSRIRQHSGPYIPGPLQTPGYATAVIETFAQSLGHKIEGINEAVERRMERADLVGTASHHYEFIIHEAALISGPPVDGFHRLRELAHHTVNYIQIERW